MTPHRRTIVGPVLCALVAVLAIAVPSRVSAQSGSAASTSADSVKNLPLTAAERLSYVGNYSVSMANGDTGPARILEEGGVLKMQPQGSPPVPLLYQGENRFRPVGIPDFLIVFVLEGGKATKFTVQKDDGLMIGVKVPAQK